jgi:hypothetical protein
MVKSSRAANSKGGRLSRRSSKVQNTKKIKKQQRQNRCTSTTAISFDSIISKSVKKFKNVLNKIDVKQVSMLPPTSSKEISKLKLPNKFNFEKSGFAVKQSMPKKYSNRFTKIMKNTIKNIFH